MSSMKNEYTNTETIEDTIDLGKFFRLIWDRKWIILAMVIISAAAAIYYLKVATPIYRATATVIIEFEEMKPVTIEDSYSLSSGRKEYLATQLEMFRTESIAQQVIDKLELENNATFNTIGKDKSLIDSIKVLLGIELEKKRLTGDVINQILVNKLRSQLHVEPVPNTQLVKISYESNDPELARKIANTVGQTYIDSHIIAKTELTNTAMNWILSRGEKTQSELLAAELELQEYRESADIVDLDEGVQTLNVSTIKNLNERLIALNAEKIDLENTIGQIERVNSEKVTSFSDSGVLKNSAIALDVLRALTAAEGKVTELDQRYGPKHPKMIAANKEVSQLKTKLNELLIDEIKERNNQLQKIQDNIAQINAQLKDAEADFLTASSKESEYNRLRANVARLTELNDMMKTRFKEMDITSDFNSFNARFADKARTPIAPAKPNKALVLALTIILSTGVAVFVVLISALTKDTFESSDDLKFRTKLELLGEVPKAKKALAKHGVTDVYATEEDPHFNESLRSIRTSFLLMNDIAGKKVVLVTSSIPEEGKTTVAINLANCLKEVKERVLLIDMDLRRPTLAKTFGIDEKHSGVTECVSGTSTIAESIVNIGNSGLDVMVAGQSESNAVKTITSNKLKLVFEELRSAYDYIIIDSAPCQVVSDTFLISKLVHSTLLVARANLTSNKDLTKTLNKFKQAGESIDGVIFNDSKVDKELYRYQSEYIA